MNASAIKPTVATTHNGKSTTILGPVLGPNFSNIVPDFRFDFQFELAAMRYCWLIANSTNSYNFMPTQHHFGSDRWHSR